MSRRGARRPRRRWIDATRRCRRSSAGRSRGGERNHRQDGVDRRDQGLQSRLQGGPRGRSEHKIRRLFGGARRRCWRPWRGRRRNNRGRHWNQAHDAPVERPTLIELSGGERISQYIDARPLTASSTNLLQRTAGPYMWVKLGSGEAFAKSPVYPRKRTLIDVVQKS